MQLYKLFKKSVMKSKLKFFPIKILNKKFVFHVFAMAIISWPFNTTAQKPEFFTINGREINIDTLNKQIINMTDEMGVKGMSLAVIDENQIVFYNSYGFRNDDKKVNKRTVFSGLSLSKNFLAFVTYQLVDEGKLDLDKPMYQYRIHERLEYDDRYKLITARMVLSHSSGMENWPSWNNRDTLEIISSPGKKFVYSGAAYQYLARVIETILNQSYEEYINERIIKPLKLKNTYLKYTQKHLGPFHKESPSNYAVGYRVFGQQSTFKNTNTRPAAGNHFTAEDYAKLILAFFDSTKLTSNRKDDILQPIVSIHNSSIFYGPGFELIMSNEDTIIAHGGDSEGYRNQMFYSVKKKIGFVFMTNSDCGKLMTDRLCKMTVALNIDSYFKAQYFISEQYPSIALSLLKVHEKKGYDAMVVELEKLKREKKIGVNTLNVLSDIFRWGGDLKGAEKLLEDNIRLYPDSSLAYSLLAEVFIDMEQYDLAIKNFKKATELNFSSWDLEFNIKKCEKKLAEIERRKGFLTRITSNKETTIEAEDYNSMDNIKIERSLDEGGGHVVGCIDRGGWVDYQIDISEAGTYLVTFRVESLKEGGQLELRSKTAVLTTIDIPSTNGLQKWTSITKEVALPPGGQTLKLYTRAGAVNVNWLKFHHP
jgi:CubicO group peptidase (beta-lactamase class C family)